MPRSGATTRARGPRGTPATRARGPARPCGLAAPPPCRRGRPHSCPTDQTPFRICTYTHTHNVARVLDVIIQVRIRSCILQRDTNRYWSNRLKNCRRDRRRIVDKSPYVVCAPRSGPQNRPGQRMSGPINRPGQHMSGPQNRPGQATASPVRAGRSARTCAEKQAEICCFGGFNSRPHRTNNLHDLMFWRIRRTPSATALRWSTGEGGDDYSLIL